MAFDPSYGNYGLYNEGVCLHLLWHLLGQSKIDIWILEKVDIFTLVYGFAQKNDFSAQIYHPKVIK
jgi:hypothetical protein